MKEKIIETAGKTWRALGEKGETSLSDMVKIVKEKEELVYQALGWLAREDKISYSTKNNKTFVSLIESEMQAFQRIMQKPSAPPQSGPSKSGNSRWSS